MENSRVEHFVDENLLAEKFPTHSLNPHFWEELGRTVATYGFMEETLAKAIFALSGTKKHSKKRAEAEYQRWLPSLSSALAETLPPLIDRFEKAFRNHQEIDADNSNNFFEEVRASVRLRNLICHASWHSTNDQNTAKPLFFDKNGCRADFEIDVKTFVDIQIRLRRMICAIINSVTLLGYNFPGAHGPGEDIW